MTPEQFAAIVDEHYQPLYRFAHSLSGNEADASDLVQQTFFIWARKSWQLRDASKTKTWLFTTLRREFLRGKRRYDKMFADAGDEPRNHAVVAPEQVDRLDAATILEAMKRLPLEYREPLSLFYMKEFSYQEIADVLEVPIGTVMSRLSRAKKQLRDKLNHDRP